jgi:hypothetical protein
MRGAAAVPVSRCEPADATYAAPISATDAVWVGRSAPPIMSAMLRLDGANYLIRDASDLVAVIKWAAARAA